MIDWKSIRAAVFDLDGTLIDSARIWQEVDEIFFARRGMAVPPGYAEEIAHLGFAESAALTVRRYLPSERAEEVIEEWRALSLSRYRAEEGARYFKPGAIRLVSRMREAGLRLCVATASLPEFFRPILRAGGIESLFDDVVTVADAGKTRAFPTYSCTARSAWASRPRRAPCSRTTARRWRRPAGRGCAPAPSMTASRSPCGRPSARTRTSSSTTSAAARPSQKKVDPPHAPQKVSPAPICGRAAEEKIIRT